MFRDFPVRSPMVFAPVPVFRPWSAGAVPPSRGARPVFGGLNAPPGLRALFSSRAYFILIPSSLGLRQTSAGSTLATPSLSAVPSP